jgi:hypothetical protein
MSVVAVTRLRLRDPGLIDEFLQSALALLDQAQGSQGMLGADAMSEANNTWWTCTVWDARTSIGRFVNTDPHRSTMSRLDDWCDEASFADWEQDGAAVPDWQTCYQHLIRDGQAAALSHASPENATLAFPAPVLG